MEDKKRLTRSRRDRVIGGVLGGLAEYFSIDSTLLRLIFIFIFLVSIKGAILLYIVLYIVIPDEKNVESSIIEVPYKNNFAVGLILILLGFVLFFNELYHFLTFRLIWPLALIILGFYVLFKGIKEEKNENR